MISPAVINALGKDLITNDVTAIIELITKHKDGNFIKTFNFYDIIQKDN